MFASRLNNLDCMRLFLAILVIYSHCYPLGLGKEEIEPMMRLSHGQTTFGTLAVDVFFIISGFLITNSFLRAKSYAEYFKKRIARIYPGFILCMLFCFFLVAPLASITWTSHTPTGRFLNLVGQTLILQHPTYTDVFPQNHYHALNGSIWSISYEFYCYIGIAIFGLFHLLKSRRTILILFLLSLCTLLAIGILAHLPPQTGGLLGKLTSHAYLLERAELRFPLIPMFLAGMVFFLYRDIIPHKTSLALASFALLSLSLYLPHAWFPAFALAGAYLTFWIGFHPHIHLHNFARFGDFSYGTYLYAFPLQQLLLLWIGPTLNPFLLLAMAAPLSLLFAIASWHGVEKWFLAAGRKHGADAPILPTKTHQPQMV